MPPADRDYCLHEIVATHHFQKVVKVVDGGAQRQDSVRHGLLELAPDVEIVIVHDAVRPFLTMPMIAGTIEAAANTARRLSRFPCAIPSSASVPMD